MLEDHIDALNSVLGIEHIEYKKTLLTSEIKLKNNIFDSMVNSIKNLTIENNDLKENLKMQIENSKSKSKGMSI